MTTITTTIKTTHQKTFKGVVVSDKMAKTVVVAVTTFFRHPKYGKYIKRTKRYQADDQAGAYQVGDKVIIGETRPLSRHKSFVVVGRQTN